MRKRNNRVPQLTLILIRQYLSTVNSERGRRDHKPWPPERAVGSKARTYETSPLGECGVAFKALSHCPRLEGSLALRGSNNVGLELAIRSLQLRSPGAAASTNPDERLRRAADRCVHRCAPRSNPAAPVRGWPATARIGIRRNTPTRT